MNCRLCNSPDTSLLLSDHLHRYHECGQCRVTFADPEGFLAPDVEKSRYDFHQNDPEDEGYLNFVSQLAGPIQKQLKNGDKGLDYGSGPGPAMQLLFEKEGWEMECYDPFYLSRAELLEKKYEFITCSETAEHFYNPRAEFEKLWSMLNPGGLLGIMTLMLTDRVDFESWHYRRDDTHVLFYRADTFTWLAGNLKGECEIHSDRVILLKKPD